MLLLSDSRFMDIRANNRGTYLIFWPPQETIEGVDIEELIKRFMNNSECGIRIIWSGCIEG